jgi:hypothetical protein
MGALGWRVRVSESEKVLDPQQVVEAVGHGRDEAAMGEFPPREAEVHREERLCESLVGLPPSEVEFYRAAERLL